jgi:hypothetical protein
MGRIDTITFNESADCYIVTDDYGVDIMYDSTLADMSILEQEMLKIMSFYVNKVEPLQDVDFRNIFPVVDRFAIIKEILIYEERY